MTRAKTFILAILLVGVCTGMAMAQPTIHGPQSGILGPGTYLVDGNLTVEAGNSLTVVPGTTLLFAGHFSFKIYGTLNAVGTENDSILFVRQRPNSNCEWSGLRFMAGATANSVVSYALFDGARYQVWPDYYGGAISTNVPVAISHCSILNCYASSGGGLYINNVNSGTVTLTNCIIMNNSAGNGGAIYIYNCSATVVVSNNAIARNSSTST